MFKYKWADDNEAVIFWEDEKIGITKTKSTGKAEKDGVPLGSKEVVCEWLIEKSKNNDESLDNLVLPIAAILSNRFEQIPDGNDE